MQTDGRYNEKEVLELLAKGSSQGFAHLFERYRPRIYSVAMRFLKSTELADEVVQDVFVKIWKGREGLVRIHNFEAYLFTMTRNLIFDGLKRLAEEAEAKKDLARSVPYAEGADHSMIEKQYEELLQEAVDLLPPKQRQVFRLAKVEGLSHQAIAEQLQISKLTVKTHMAKALQTIRQNLQHHIITIGFLPLILC